MLTETVTLQIPEILYQRLANTARVTRRPLEEIILRSLQVVLTDARSTIITKLPKSTIIIPIFLSNNTYSVSCHSSSSTYMVRFQKRSLSSQRGTFA